jgi:hypothetical protein
MAFPDRARPRVSRETRLLLTTVFLSIAALWVLARIRFPERPATPNPVTPLLAQLSPRRVLFEDLERAVFELEPEALSALHVLSVQPAGPAGGWDGSGHSIASLRFRDDAVVALMDTVVGVSITGGKLLAHDPVTGLAVIRTASSELPPLRTWTPQSTDYPRYVLVSDASQGSISLRPVFVGHLRAVPKSAWSGDTWRMTSDVTLPNGTFVFTTSGALAGMVVGQPDEPAIVPASTLISSAQRLLEQDQAAVGSLGINVQPLTPQLQGATGLKSGVVVTRVDPKSPAAGKIVATDIIDAVDRYTILTKADWDAHATRVPAGNMITLRIRRSGRTEEVQVTAFPPAAAAASSRLGLTMRVRSGIGTEVLYVEDGSAAMLAGIAVNDVLTRFGEWPAPMPEQINDAFAAATKDRALLVAVTRGGSHFVVALVKQ